MAPARTRIAVAALVHDGLVLLGHRHPSRRWYPDCWDLVGGHVYGGESPHRAVVRECLEELGVHIIDPSPIPMSVDDPHLEMDGFLVTRWEGEVVNAAPDEHDELRWCAAGDLAGLALAHPEILPIILGALQGGDGDC